VLKEPAGKTMIISHSIDFLIRLKNASRAGNSQVKLPYTKYCHNIADLLKKNHYIDSYVVEGDALKTLSVTLFSEGGQSRINDVKIISKPGRRYYEKGSSLPWGTTKDALFIISTSNGVVSQREAKKLGIGGELVAEIW
jgi:small subunit ribosomal protein S8